MGIIVISTFIHLVCECPSNEIPASWQEEEKMIASKRGDGCNDDQEDSLGWVNEQSKTIFEEVLYLD